MNVARGDVSFMWEVCLCGWFTGATKTHLANIDFFKSYRHFDRKIEFLVNNFVANCP